MEQRQRIAYLDALRLAATLAVMVIHLAATGCRESAPGSSGYVVCLIYNTLARFAVPVFVMISGAMYLDPAREVTMKQMLKKTGKLMAVFLCWSLVYALTESVKDYPVFSGAYFLAAAHRLVQGHYHMWYLYAIAGLYLATPFLRAVAAEEKLLKLYLGAVFVQNFCLRIFAWIPGWEETAEPVLRYTGAGIFSGYTGYYFLGYYLHRKDFSERQCRRLFLAALLMLGGFLIAGILLERPAMAYAENMPQIFLYAAGVFLLFKRGAKKDRKKRGLLEKIIPCTFGMYLIHPAVNFLLRKAGLYALTFAPVLCVPLCALLVFIISFAAVWCLRRIPLLKELT